MEEKRVYVVSSGGSSDHRIAGVFDTKESAEEFAAKNDAVRIEAFTLNEPTDHAEQGKKAFHVRMKKDGTVVRVDSASWSNASFAANDYMSEDFRYSECKFVVLRVNCLASNEAQATSIANEIRLERLESRQWEQQREV